VDGAHDMGGMHGFGAVPAGTQGGPLFRERWEGRVSAMLGTVLKGTTIDRFRFTIEQMPPSEYLASTYYERWLWAIERLATEQGLLESSVRPPSPPWPSATTPVWPGRFEVGQPVRVRNAVTAGHTRVPRYLRRHVGRVERVAVAWPNPGASAATGIYGEPELVYTVAFAGSDLFGGGADHTVTADLAESDLEQQ
jgi:nitrile hydratase subunit beta